MAEIGNGDIGVGERSVRFLWFLVGAAAAGVVYAAVFPEWRSRGFICCLEGVETPTGKIVVFLASVLVLCAFLGIKAEYPKEEGLANFTVAAALVLFCLLVVDLRPGLRLGLVLAMMGATVAFAASLAITALVRDWPWTRPVLVMLAVMMGFVLMVAVVDEPWTAPTITITLTLTVFAYSALTKLAGRASPRSMWRIFVGSALMGLSLVAQLMALSDKGGLTTVITVYRALTLLLLIGAMLLAIPNLSSQVAANLAALFLVAIVFGVVGIELVYTGPAPPGRGLLLLVAAIVVQAGRRSVKGPVGKLVAAIAVGLWVWVLVDLATAGETGNIALGQEYALTGLTVALMILLREVVLPNQKPLTVWLAVLGALALVGLGIQAWLNLDSPETLVATPSSIVIVAGLLAVCTTMVYSSESTIALAAVVATGVAAIVVACISLGQFTEATFWAEYMVYEVGFGSALLAVCLGALFVSDPVDRVKVVLVGTLVVLAACLVALYLLIEGIVLLSPAWTVLFVSAAFFVSGHNSRPMAQGIAIASAGVFGIGFFSIMTSGTIVTFTTTLRELAIASLAIVIATRTTSPDEDGGLLVERQTESELAESASPATATLTLDT